MFNTLVFNKDIYYGKGRVFTLVFLSLLFSGFSSCDFQKSKKKKIESKEGKESHFAYDLKNPDKNFDLPASLNEISGISYYDKNKIVCVQDEKAVIYFFDTKKGKVIKKYDFGEDADFEDISVVGDNAYALRSDGTLFKIRDFQKNQKKTIKINTSLDGKNNTEGLAFDRESNSLLIACKDSPSINEEELHGGFNAIYRFDLKNEKLIEKPEYLLDFKIVDKIRFKGSIEKIFVEAARKLNLTEDETSFHPSGIAINPLETEKIYMISGVEKLMIVMDKDGMILDIIDLDSRIFNQPEGICFSNDGDLFISNEGENGDENILKFKPEKGSFK